MYLFCLRLTGETYVNVSNKAFRHIRTVGTSSATGSSRKETTSSSFSHIKGNSTVKANMTVTLKVPKNRFCGEAKTTPTKGKKSPNNNKK